MVSYDLVQHDVEKTDRLSRQTGEAGGGGGKRRKLWSRERMEDRCYEYVDESRVRLRWRKRRGQVLTSR